MRSVKNVRSGIRILLAARHHVLRVRHVHTKTRQVKQRVNIVPRADTKTKTHKRLVRHVPTVTFNHKQVREIAMTNVRAVHTKTCWVRHPVRIVRPACIKVHQARIIVTHARQVGTVQRTIARAQRQIHATAPVLPTLAPFAIPRRTSCVRHTRRSRTRDLVIARNNVVNCV